MIDSNTFVQDYLTHVVVGNKQQCLHIVRQYLGEGHTLTELYENVIKESLYKVGKLWEINKISVATEHLATAITEGILNDLYYDCHFNLDNNRRVVLACVENEQHQVGIKMVADTFESYGWETFFLGTGISTAELMGFIRETKPRLLAVSLSIYFNYLSLSSMLDQIKGEFKDLEIVVGGQAFNEVYSKLESKFSHVNVMADLYQLKQFIETKN